jgi:hypothetical protein
MKDFFFRDIFRPMKLRPITKNKVRGGAILAFGAVLTFTALPADARDDRLKMPIADAMNTPDAKAKLSPQIRFFFGTQKHAAPTRSFGEYTANRKTSFLGKGDKDGCAWVFLSSAIALQERARQLGGNAVINIRSAYKNVEFSSETEYECGAGTFAGGVALRGEVVLIP